MRFGISTHLFRGTRLTRDQLGAVAAHGFEAIELFPTRADFDYRDPEAVALLAEGLEQHRLALHSIHAPIYASAHDGLSRHLLSLAAASEEARQRALDEAAAVLEVAARVPFEFLVVHLGTPDAVARDNQEGAARQSMATLVGLCRARGVRLALEIIPNGLSTAAGLVSLLEEEGEMREAGICLDFGHARLMGDLADAIETTSGFVVTTHVHDNRGRQDDHLVPFEGDIEWAEALTALQKVGYDGAFLFELAPSSAPVDVLRRAREARRQFERILA